MKKIKAVIFILFLTFDQLSNGQAIKILTPKLGTNNDYTQSEQIFWTKAIGQLDKLNNIKLDYKNLSDSEKKNIDSLEMGNGPCPIDGGDNWYNAGGPYKTTSTSYLNSKKDTTAFSPNNLSDNNLLTSWSPDSRKGVVGQKINFCFRPFSPRVDEVIIYNGYIKNKELWKDNARVKKLKLYVNGKPYAILNLMDVTAGQSFLTDTFQSKDSSKDLILTFEILEVYKGSKYKDVAISEVVFDGLDVLCLGSGTKIFMADQTEKNIESIRSGDSVITFDTERNSYKKTIVTKLIKARHSHLVKLIYDNIN